MELNGQEIAALESESLRSGFFFRLATSPVLALWLGNGSIAPGVNEIDAAGITYRGLGQISAFPEIQQLINGEAERVELSLSGVSADVLAIASEEDAPNVKGKEAAVGFAILSEDYSSLLGAIKWIRRYEADYLGVSQGEAGDPESPIIRTVTLSAGSAMTARRRPKISFFNDPDQKTRSPTDDFLERVARYSAQVEKRWPRISGS